MNNVLTLILAIVIVIVGGILTFFAIGSQWSKPRPVATCQPTNAPVPPAPGPIEAQALINWHEGLVTPRVTHVQGSVVFLVVNNIGARPHNVILASVGTDCKETELRRYDGLLNNGTFNIRISLQPGTYIINCDIREGRTTHRERGEIAQIIVH